MPMPMWACSKAPRKRSLASLRARAPCPGGCTGDVSASTRAGLSLTAPGKLGRGKRETDPCPAPRPLLRPDAAALGFYEPTGDRESEAGATPAARRVGA